MKQGPDWKESELVTCQDSLWTTLAPDCSKAVPFDLSASPIFLFCCLPFQHFAYQSIRASI